VNDLPARRRYFAEELEAICGLRTPALVEAFATVAREDFLPAGPWLVRSEMDYLSGPPRQTPDADVRRLSHNIAVAIDPARLLFNGAPSLLGTCVDRLELAAGQRVLHVGCGLGYYSAVMAHCVGPAGRVVAVEVDPDLAAKARENLSPLAQATVRVDDDGSHMQGETFDAILVNAGVTHPLDSWLDALSPGGRMILPLTATMPSMGPIGKGPLILLTRRDADFDAKLLTVVAIYSAVGIRDAALNERIGKALMRGQYPNFSRLRRDAHEESAICWLHGPGFCLSA
jgi:protein-L-isoaspartate(D-aspartate) O-methyltransferase